MTGNENYMKLSFARFEWLIKFVSEFSNCRSTGFSIPKKNFTGWKTVFRLI